MRNSVNVLIDTAPFLWALEDANLTKVARDALLDTENELYLSAASAWEIAIKYALGKLPLPVPPHRLIPQQRELRGIRSLPIDEQSTLRVAGLSAIHPDPFDRIIVAQAIEHAMTILTPDPLIQAYPVRTVW